MTRFATITPQGGLTGFYDDSINVIPPGAVTLSDSQYAQWLTAQSTLVWQNGALVPAPPSTAAPSPQQQALAMMAAGLQITSTGTPAMDATYPTDDIAQGKVSAIELRLAANLGFPGGGATMPWKDTTGGWHQLTVAQFTALAGAISLFVAQLDLVIDGYPGAVLPPATATIP